MANNPFDQRIINQLERPTSSDLNIAQGQINANVRAFARQLLQSTQSAWNTGTGPGGALGNSFIIRAAAAPSLTEVTMTRGVGFAAYADVANNIGGITGLNTNLDYPVIYSQDRVLDLSGAPNPATPSTCRRDVIAIRAIGQSEQGLTDSGETDIYEPLLEAFQSAPRFKTLTADLTGQNLTVLDNTQPTTQPIVCIKGAEALYSGPDSFLSAPITAATTNGYINIAIINRYEGQLEITESDIVDYRLVASPGGQITISGIAAVGATSALDGPGSALTGVTIKAPPGIKAAIYKMGADAAYPTNTYVLAVAGPRGIASASASYTLGVPAGPTVFGIPTPITASTLIYPTTIMADPYVLNQAADAAVVDTYADPAKVSPVSTLAVGQPMHFFPFTIGTVENVVDSELVPIYIAQGTVTLPNPPGYPAMYPAGTYDVTGNTNTRTYYLNYNVAASSPTTGLQTPTYQLGTSSTSTSSNITSAVTTAWDRIVGFVASYLGEALTIPSGVWKFSLRAGSAGTAVTVRLSAYLYNGINDPEAGALLAQSDNIILPDAGASNETQYIDIYMRFGSPISVGTNRIYVVLEATAASASNAYFRFGNDNPAILETNIATATPTVTIPDSTDAYPAGDWDVVGTSADPLVLAQPKSYTKLNAAATAFRVEGTNITRTIPINFTVTLNRS